MSARIDEELVHLRQFYGEVEYVAEGRWVRLRPYRLPDSVFDQSTVELCFQIPDNYPGQGPYAFYVMPPVRLADGIAPDNFELGVLTGFGSGWGKFSWNVDPWVPKATAVAGDNLVTFVRSCGYRLREGK